MYNSYAYIKSSDSNQKPGWYYLSLDSDISFYYQTLSKQKWSLPLNGVHITFIAGEKDDRIVLEEEIKSYLDQPISFYYSHILHNNKVSFWLDAYSKELDNLRSKLGLSLKRFGYHITLGNNK